MAGEYSSRVTNEKPLGDRQNHVHEKALSFTVRAVGYPQHVTVSESACAVAREGTSIHDDITCRHADSDSDSERLEKSRDMKKVTKLYCHGFQLQL